MKLSKFGILAIIVSFTFFACDKDDESGNPSDGDSHNGEVVNVNLGYTDFVNANSLKSTTEDF